MMKRRTVDFCMHNKLCCSCGLCADVCSVNAITIKQKNNIFVPEVNKEKCINCGLCFDICSGKGNDWYNKAAYYSKFQISKTEYAQDLGFFSSCYIAHSTDYETRFHCASGGVITTLLVFMLHAKLIDGAIVTRFSKKNPLAVETIIAKTEEEIRDAKSSKYCPVHMDGIIEQLKNIDGKVAFVGLPCQIQTLRNIEEKFDWVKNKVYLHIGLFCSGTKDSRALNYLLRKNGFALEGITKFAYRDDGCLGCVKVTYGTNFAFVPYVQAYSHLHSYFKPERCVSCIDHFAYLSDISLGDIDCMPYNEDKIGSNSVIVRTDIAKELIKTAVKERILDAEEISFTEIIRSQKVLHFRKTLFVADRFLHRILFKSVPFYDKLPDSKIMLKGVFWFLSYKLQRFFSRIGIIR